MLDVIEDDFSFHTLKNVVTNYLYNDLGFIVKNKLFILIEHQSKISLNILIRMLLYLAASYESFFYDNKELDLYSTTKISIPKPELYLLYTGQEKLDEDYLDMAKGFFNGDDFYLQLRIKVLKSTTSRDILDQYVGFCHIVQEQRKLYGRSLKSISEAIRICKEKDILKEYLSEKEKEVINTMLFLFDQEDAINRMINSSVAKAIEETTKRVREDTEKRLREDIEKSVREELLGKKL